MLSFKKARFLWRAVFIELFHILNVWLSCCKILGCLVVVCLCGISNAEEVITINADFSKKEVLAIYTEDGKSPLHEFFEGTFELLFSQVPYLLVQVESDQNMNTSFADDVIVNGVLMGGVFRPNFQLMEEKQYGYVLNYNITQKFGKYAINYTVYDKTYKEVVTFGEYTFTESGIEKVSRNIASNVFFKITAEFPFFIGKLMYTQRDANTGRQVLFSQDIYQRKTKYTHDSTLLTSPSYCSGGKRIFASIKEEDELMNIQEINLLTLTKSVVNLPQVFSEMNLSSPEISPDCKNLLFAASNGYNSAIYLYDATLQKTMAIVKDSNINTRPSFAQNGSVYYISNKYGSPKIFSKSQTGMETLISRGMGAYIYYAISPDGTKIAFTKIHAGKFYVGVMNIDGSVELLMKKGYIIEAPSWAPFGTNFIVAAQEGTKSIRQVYSISSTTGHSYPLWVQPAEIVQVNWVVGSGDSV